MLPRRFRLAERLRRLRSGVRPRSRSQGPSRSSAPVEAKAEPRNPAGAIPTILTDSDGNQYEVFTPEGGGTFTGDTSSLKAGPGVVPNGEIVGLRISDGGSASNEGKTYQRYSLGGNWYRDFGGRYVQQQRFVIRVERCR